jgi:carbonic anhydrase
MAMETCREQPDPEIPRAAAPESIGEIDMTQNFDEFAFSRRPGYDEPTVRKEFAQLMPLRTIVVYCYDPRAAGIPEAVAKEFGDVFPGELLTDEAGNGIATTGTMLTVVVAGGRAGDALRSITVGQHLFSIENVVIVHHTYCGATSYTEAGIAEAFRRELGQDIEGLYPSESVCIRDYRSSLEHDVALVRASAGTPKHANIYGYVYDIDRLELTRICQDESDVGQVA